MLCSYKSADLMLNPRAKGLNFQVFLHSSQVFAFLILLIILIFAKIKRCRATQVGDSTRNANLWISLYWRFPSLLNKHGILGF